MQNKRRRSVLRQKNNNNTVRRWVFIEGTNVDIGQRHGVDADLLGHPALRLQHDAVAASALQLHHPHLLTHLPHSTRPLHLTVTLGSTPVEPPAPNHFAIHTHTPRLYWWPFYIHTDYREASKLNSQLFAAEPGAGARRSGQIGFGPDLEQCRSIEYLSAP